MGSIEKDIFNYGMLTLLCVMIREGFRNSILNPLYVLGKAHNWIRVNRRNNKLGKYDGDDRRGSSEIDFPKYVRKPIYNIGVLFIGCICFIEGALSVSNLKFN